MNDRLDTMLLERFSNQHDALPAGDLADVRERMSQDHRRETTHVDGFRLSANGRRRRGPAVVVAALVAAVLLSAAAYAVARLAIVGSPAPPPVRASEKMLGQVKDAMTIINRGGPTVEVAKTKAAAVLNTSSGPVYLWVAPTTSGSRCLYLQITGLDVRFAGGGPFLMTAGCVVRHESGALFRVNTGVDGHTLALVAGYLPAPAQTLQLRFADGTTSGRFPITGGFVIAQGSPSDPDPTAIVRDRQGHVITPNPAQGIRQLFVSTSPTGPTQFTLTVPLLNHEGNLVLSVGPAAKGGRCTRLHLPWFVAGGCGPHKTTADSIEVFQGFSAKPGDALHHHIWYLNGEVGVDISSLELRFQDGSRQDIPIHHHWVLYQINPRNVRAGHQPTELIGRNAAGATIATHNISISFCLVSSCRKNVKVTKLPKHA